MWYTATCVSLSFILFSLFASPAFNGFFVCREIGDGLTERPKTRIWEAGKRDLEFHACAIVVAGSDNAASDGGVLAIWELCDVGHARRVTLDDLRGSEFAVNTWDRDRSTRSLSAGECEAGGQGEESCGMHCWCWFSLSERVMLEVEFL